MRRLYVKLTEDELERLQKLAQEQRRHPSAEAGVLLSEALRRREAKCGELTFRQLQTEQIAWVQHNFPGRDTYYPLLGAMEELGELSHHHLKRIQGVRGTAAEHHEKAKDAIADVIIFLSDYCTANGYDLQEIMETTWAEVKQRDWRKDPERGGSESVPCWEAL